LITKWSHIIGQPLVDKEQDRGSQLTPLSVHLVSHVNGIEIFLGLQISINDI
jgi:hypothetical protein